jgi:hypothetical protein
MLPAWQSAQMTQEHQQDAVSTVQRASQRHNLTVRRKQFKVWSGITNVQL